MERFLEMSQKWSAGQLSFRSFWRIWVTALQRTIRLFRESDQRRLAAAASFSSSLNRGYATIRWSGFLAAFLTACSSPPPVEPTPKLSAFSDAGQYVIGPGDVLSIFVYEAPPLSVTELPVRPDGRISVPLVPDVLAAGKTPSQLGSTIATSLKKYVNNPNVTVMVRSFQGPADRQVRVIGEATDPQAIPYRENMSLLDVMIATKGLTKFAAGNRAVIVRHVGAFERRIPVHLSDLIKDGDISQNMMMHPGDTLIIPQSFF